MIRRKKQETISDLEKKPETRKWSEERSKRPLVIRRRSQRPESDQKKEDQYSDQEKKAETRKWSEERSKIPLMIRKQKQETI